MYVSLSLPISLSNSPYFLSSKFYHVSSKNLVLIGSINNPLIDIFSLFACLILDWYFRQKFHLSQSWELGEEDIDVTNWTKKHKSHDYSYDILKMLHFQEYFFFFSFFHQKSKTPVVTTAEVSSDQSTNADSPEQPQAITMATQPKPSLSTVHVQQSFHGIRSSIPVLTHSASEVKFTSCFYCNFDFCQPLFPTSVCLFSLLLSIYFPGCY